MASIERASTADSSDTASCITVGRPASSSSTPVSHTPPTSVSESSAAFSTSPSVDRASEMSRSMRKRGSQPEYNLKKLAGTAVHTRRLYLGLPTRAEIKAAQAAEKTEKAAQLLLTSAIAADSELEDGSEEAANDNEAGDEPSRVFDASFDDTMMEDNKTDIDDSLGAESFRSLRERGSKPLYNLTYLSGTDHHIRRGFLTNDELAARDARREARKSSAHSSLTNTPVKSSKQHRDGSIVSKGSSKAAKRKSIGHNQSPLKNSTSLTSVPNFVSNAVSAASSKLKGAAKTAKDKLTALGSRKRKASSLEEEDSDEEDTEEPLNKRPRLINYEEEEPIRLYTGELIRKKYELKGRFSGQERGIDPRYHNAKTKMGMPDLSKERYLLPLPMFRMGAFLDEDKDPKDNFEDFKLPYIVMNRRNQVINRDWKEVDTSRFVGEAKTKWNVLNLRKQHENSFCSCTLEDGCEEDCLNRCTNVECDKTNCKLPPEKCCNRRFGDFDRRLSRHERLEKHTPVPVVESSDESNTKQKITINPYDLGVEVIDTGKRGRGVRAIRSFVLNQMIMEYCGEIVTQAEMDRRMNEDYKDKYKHFYLMQLSDFLPGLEKMVIDATKRGSMARFVNHSCEPNCRIEQVVVDGRPRVGLFATRRIFTGEELTYDYNFSPFSDDNVQECFCGSHTCRGFLGPKPSRERLKEIEAELQRKLALERKKQLELEKKRQLEAEKQKQKEATNSLKRKIQNMLTGSDGKPVKDVSQPVDKRPKGWKGWVSLEVVEAEKRLKAKMQSQPSIRQQRLMARQSVTDLSARAAPSRAASMRAASVRAPSVRATSVRASSVRAASASPDKRRSHSPKRASRPSDPLPLKAFPKHFDSIRRMKQTTLSFPSFNK